MTTPKSSVEFTCCPRMYLHLAEPTGSLTHDYEQEVQPVQHPIQEALMCILSEG